MRGYPDTPVGFVDPACPVNWAHPLNRGLLSWFNGVSNTGWFGSRSVNDCVKNKRVANTASNWANRKWYNYVATAASCTDLNLTSNFSLVAWIYVTATMGASDFPQIGNNVYVSESNNQGYTIIYRGAFTTGWVFSLLNNWDLTQYASGAYNAENSPGLKMLVGTTNGTTKSLYMNGKLVTSTGTGVTCASCSGNWGNLTGNGLWQIWETKTYNQCLSAIQVALLYDEFRKGNPETLNWVSTRSIFLPPAAATTNRRRRLLLGT